MSAEVETMFYVREKPWHGLGTKVNEAPCSKEALVWAGLDWQVIQKKIFTENGQEISGFKANVRSTDEKILGVVSDRYQIVQNKDAFAFTDDLLGSGVRYETAGSLQGGRRVWMLAIMPRKYKILGDDYSAYMVFTNSHDGTGSVKAAMTPIRVVCNNTLNLALSSAERSWSANHVGSFDEKLRNAEDTMMNASEYMKELSRSAESMYKNRLSDNEVKALIDALCPKKEALTERQDKNIKRIRDDIWLRYNDAPDLKDMERTAYRFINAVSDSATHNPPARKTVNYQDNLFARTVDGNAIIDKAFQLIA